MIDILPLELEDYCEIHSTQETKLLYNLNRETHLSAINPRMLSGHLQGAFLTLISKLLKPDRILEIGTYTGYATLCLSEGLTQTGVIDTIEKNIEKETIIKKYFSKSRFESQINLYMGDALKLLPGLNDVYDLAFIDGDKEEYLSYYQIVLPKMRKGGLMLIDNVLWNGKVINSVPHYDKDTISLQKFNDFVQDDDRVKNLLLPFRDGIMIVEKL